MKIVLSSDNIIFDSDYEVNVMRDLNEYVNICIGELNNIGIFPGKILGLEINSRAKKRWGLCSPKYDENLNIIGYVISINKVLLDEKYPEKALKSTIIHELLHACEGGLTHKNVWKKLAEKVNRELGYDIRRVGSKDKDGISVDVDEAIPRYIIKCQDCGEIYKRKRRSKVVTHPENYRCGKCKGKLVSYVVTN